mmetsp:Transcript_8405/g.17342  ORF Transcript_8405/g.17342 Transcript_8405/m.17342 type:complete len:81 (+) Transcript_8405:131-373(+)
MNMSEAQQLKLAETELRAITDMYNRMQEKCFTKCIHRIKKDPDLAVGEMACVDRCVAKYLEVHDKVGEVYQKMQAGLQPQ